MTRKTVMNRQVSGKRKGRSSYAKIRWAAAAMALPLAGANVDGTIATPIMHVRAAESGNSIIDGTQTKGSILITRKEKNQEGNPDAPLSGSK